MADAGSSDRDVVVRDGGRGLVGQGAAGRHGVEDGGGWDAGESGEFDAGRDGVEVGDRGSARDENEVGRPRGGERGRFGMGGGVDEGVPDVVGAGGFERRGEARRGDWNDGWRGFGVLRPAVLPCGGRGLRVEVDKEGFGVWEVGGDGEVEGEGGFAGAALLGDQSDCKHIRG